MSSGDLLSLGEHKENNTVQQDIPEFIRIPKQNLASNRLVLDWVALFNGSSGLRIAQSACRTVWWPRPGPGWRQWRWWWNEARRSEMGRKGRMLINNGNGSHIYFKIGRLFQAKHQATASSCGALSSSFGCGSTAVVCPWVQAQIRSHTHPPCRKELFLNVFGIICLLPLPLPLFSHLDLQLKLGEFWKELQRQLQIKML